MKTLEQFKQAYSEILEAGQKEKDAKAKKKIVKIAAKLREAIRWLELGVSEESLKRQVKEEKRKLKIFDERYEAMVERNELKDAYKTWCKQNKYTEIKKSIAAMNWVLNF